MKCWFLAGVFLAAFCLVASARAECPQISREQIATLAQSAMGYSYWWGHGRWRLDHTQLGSCSGSCPDCTHSGSYGADCSGLAGKVWQVPRASDVTEDYHPYSTYNFRYDTDKCWTQVSRGSTMYRADAVVYNTDGSGHIMIYDSGNAWGTPIVWECKGCSYGCVHGSHTVSTSYIGIRRKNLVTEPTQGKLQGVVYVDRGDGDMSERLAGATVTAGGKTATARDGDAYWSFTLNPGTYTVTASKSGYQTASRSCQVTEGGETWCSIGLKAVCTPDCAGKECGPDGCGESCGSCGANESCAGGKCLCQPQCAGLECGPDPLCGSSCGECSAGYVCENGHCLCKPDCSERKCGPDGCGGSCGECAPGSVCTAEGLCFDCALACQGLECGTDPWCGKECGSCPEGKICLSGQCATCSKDCAARECGPDPLCGKSCGYCQLERYCEGSTGRCLEIPADRGKLFGRVVIKPQDDGADLHQAEAIPGAGLSLDGVQTTPADELGRFEFLVQPGEHRLQARAEGFEPGGEICSVSPAAASECLLALSKAARDLEDSRVVGGCTTTAVSLPALSLLPFIFLRGRRRSH
jgi:hypothetical protein